jgi:hypothetical protein
VPGSRYRNARSTALGEVYQPLADDAASALFYNPAAFGKLVGARFEPVNLVFEGNSEFLGGMGTHSPGIFGLDGYKQHLLENPYRFESVSAQWFTGFAARGFGFGVLGRAEMGGKYEPESGVIRYRSAYQLIPAVGGGVRLASGILRLGYSLQWVNRSGADTSTPSSGSGLSYIRGGTGGSGVSGTLAGALTLPYEFLPQFDVVARNFLDSSYGGFSLLPAPSGGASLPATEKMTFDGSFMLQPKLGAGATLRWILLFRDFTGVYGASLLGRLGTALEFDLRNAFFLRGGFGNGYPSLGIGFRRRRSDFGLSWYSAERGVSYRSEREIRFLFQYQVRAF